MGKNKNLDYDAELKRFVISALRRVSLWWKPRNEAFKLARISRGLYICNICKKCFGRKEVVADHLNPVVKLSGFTNYDEYLHRMFPSVEGYQIICKPCHSIKTEEENILRKIQRDIDKNKIKG